MNSLILSPIPAKIAFDFSAIERADLQPSTRAKYQRAIDNMILAGVDPYDHDALSIYADSLSNSSRVFLKASLRIIVDGELTRIKAQAVPGNIGSIHALVARIEAMQETIKVHQPEGEITHIWLSPQQVTDITALPDLVTIRGLRDYVVLAVLLGAGLRREELENLTFDSLMQQPSKSGMRDVLAITGKGGKRRTVPISQKLARHLREWKELAGSGYVARSINKGGAMGESLSTFGINDIVHTYGAQIGLPELSCHDLRRTYSRIGYDAGVPVEQISKLLGHADVKTTMRYLGIDIDLEATASDFIPLSGD